MRTWGHTPTADDLAILTRSAGAFRKLWASINPPFPAAFDGTITDVRAIDYLQYEGFAFPACGVEGAALVCGEVVRRAARFEWVIAYTGNWFITTDELDRPSVAICPVTRLQELEFAGTPQFGRCVVLAARAALDCLPYASGEAKAPLRELIALDPEYLSGLATTVFELLPPPWQKRQKRRR